MSKAVVRVSGRESFSCRDSESIKFIRRKLLNGQKCDTNNAPNNWRQKFPRIGAAAIVLRVTQQSNYKKKKKYTFFFFLFPK